VIKSNMGKRTTIKLSQQEFTVANGKYKIYIINEDGEWSIVTRDKDYGFDFNGYTTRESLKAAKVVIKLLEKAVGFIEEKI